MTSHLLSLTLLLTVTAFGAAQTPLTTQLFGNFNAPVQLLSPPGDSQRIFVVEKTGHVRLHKNGSVLATPFLDISGLTVANYERGLLGMAFHPDYVANGYFFVNYTSASTGATVVARYRIQGGTNRDLADPNSATAILTVPQPYGNHNGGTIRFGPDRLLYIGMGDGGGSYDQAGNAQDIQGLLGKLLRIDVDQPGGGLAYGIPPGNPFVGAVPGADEVFALGLRNPWQWSFDRVTGDLYIGDVGQDTQEEIDFVDSTYMAAALTPTTVKNFGWRCTEGTWCTGLSGCTCGAANLTAPIHTFATTPGYAVVGGFVYRGCAIPDLRGSYFFGNHSSGDIWSLRVVGGVVNNLVVRTAELDPAGPDTITGISAFGEDACGELYVLEHAGQIWKIVPASGATPGGLSAYGMGTPGCAGMHALSANCAPTVGNPVWQLTSTNAPASWFGIAALAQSADFPGSDPFGIGVTLHVAVNPPTFTWLATSDANGIGAAVLPIPGSPQLIGWQVHAQILWPWPAGSCTPSPLGISSTQGLTIVFQP